MTYLIMSASDVFVLLPKEIRVSRNARAQWYLRHLNGRVQLETNNEDANAEDAPTEDDAEDEATDGEDDGVPPAASASAVALIKAVGVLGQGDLVTDSTKVWFMAQR